MRKLVILISLLLSGTALHAQNWKADWSASFRAGGTTGEYMPFWARTGEDGTLPVRSSGLLMAGADIEYSDVRGFFFEAGANIAGALSQKSPLNASAAYGFVDRLYASGGWKMLRLDVGLKPRRGELGDLSITGGDFMQSGNARAIPGVNLSSDWIYFEKGHWVGIRFNLAHYQTIDDRRVQDAMIHNKSAALKVSLGKKVDLMGGLHHYVFWGGTERGSQLPEVHSFSDFIRIFFAKRGGEDASMSDQMNALGNHLGSEWMRLVWRADSFTMNLQYDKPLEDNSGKNFQNFPDGVWTLQLSGKDRDAFVTDVTYEFINTTWQSGTVHDRPATPEEMEKQDPDDPYYGKIVIGGCDNYFSNSPYGSGWTSHGRIIGLPLILGAAPNHEGYVPGIVNTRLRGHHVGVRGVLAGKVPYRFRGTFTQNFGIYNQAAESFFTSTPWQLSLGLDAELSPSLTGLPVSFSLGVYGDIGKVYQNSLGLTLKVSYGGRRNF